MIVCPRCGSPASLRLPGGMKECRMCGNRYELPRPTPKRAPRRTYTMPVVSETVEPEITPEEKE
jgi:ribosomal protein L37AE/L43A